MSAKYTCEYCGYEMNREEYESSIDEGCPSCRHTVREQPYKCETCGDEVDDANYHCDRCLHDQYSDDCVHERLSRSF